MLYCATFGADKKYTIFIVCHFELDTVIVIVINTIVREYYY